MEFGWEKKLNIQQKNNNVTTKKRDMICLSYLKKDTHTHTVECLFVPFQAATEVFGTSREAPVTFGVSPLGCGGRNSWVGIHGPPKTCVFFFAGALFVEDTYGFVFFVGEDVARLPWRLEISSILEGWDLKIAKVKACCSFASYERNDLKETYTIIILAITFLKPDWSNTRININMEGTCPSNNLIPSNVSQFWRRSKPFPKVGIHESCASPYATPSWQRKPLRRRSFWSHFDHGGDVKNDIFVASLFGVCWWVAGGRVNIFVVKT